MTLRFGRRLSKIATLALVSVSIALGAGPCAESAATATTMSEKALLKRATKRAEPAVPGGFGRIDALIEVVVVVGTDGKVSCAEAAEPSHPLLRKYCEDAARAWEFRPLKKGGTAVRVTGPIRFRIRR